jgi:hypothetical protein
MRVANATLTHNPRPHMPLGHAPHRRECGGALGGGGSLRLSDGGDDRAPA